MRANKSKRLTVLSEAEKHALYDLPDFDDFQRAEFFAMTEIAIETTPASYKNAGINALLAVQQKGG